MVKFDWEVKSQFSLQKIHPDASSSSDLSTRQRMAPLLMLLAIISIVGGVIGFASYRLAQIQQTIQNHLHESVKAEVSFLRLGDRTQFLAVQRSASPSWLETQSILFDEYQYLKTQQRLNLDAEIVSTVIDGNRARVQVLEQIEGQPYLQTWFYWNYQDGWRHVPADYTFWGEPKTQAGDYITMNYAMLDQTIALSLFDNLERGMAQVCVWITCDPFAVLLVSREGLSVNWSATVPNQLEVSSPYVGRVALRQPLPETLMDELTLQLAKALAQANGASLQVDDWSDRAFIETQLVAYIQSYLLSREPVDNLFVDLKTHFESPKVQDVLQASSQSTFIPLLQELLAQPTLHDMPLTWEPYANWLLRKEYAYWDIEDEQGFYSIYVNDSLSQLIAMTRYAAPQINLQPFQECQWGLPEQLICTTLAAQQVEYKWQFDTFLRVN